MAGNAGTTERFTVDGNRIVINSLFDPRFQRGVEGELLQTLQSMLEEGDFESVVLDLHNRDNLPSMLVGIIVESKRRISDYGARMLLRINPEHLKSLQWAGMQRVFKEEGLHKDASGIDYLEFSSL